MSSTQYRTIAYAAGASLTAATFVYVIFGPTWFIDSNSSASASQRKRGVVGLANPANDCFINAILQSLAGLEQLREYLIRRAQLARALGVGEHGDPNLTAALKEILDALNERPIYRKTISNRIFLRELERVFKQPISRNQQDAHEFLQVVAETLAEEHARMEKARREKVRGEVAEVKEDARGEGQVMDGSVVILDNPAEREEMEQSETQVEMGQSKKQVEAEIETETMPLEGKLESEIQCQTCGFKPKPTVSTFVVLTLPVPQKSSTTLTECLNSALSAETIDDFHCAKCRLVAAIEKARTLPSAPANTRTLELLTTALKTDPETPPPGIPLPPRSSRITKRTTLKTYPDIIALHLGRSIFDTYASRKNSARVTFQEELTMGGLLDRRKYRLLCVVTHKGGHESGHYECFRRQVVARAPYSTATPAGGSARVSPGASETDISTPTETEGEMKGEKGKGKEKARKKAKKDDKWWRMSDDKIKETRTSEVLEMQKEVYLLFYQRVREE